jgi:hypothetical protein
MPKFIAALMLGTILLFAFPAATHAQEEPSEVTAAPTTAPTTKPVRVEWYSPEVLRSVKKNRARVRLSGQTVPGTKIKISGDQVPFITKKEKVVSLPTKQV